MWTETAKYGWVGQCKEKTSHLESYFQALTNITASKVCEYALLCNNIDSNVINCVGINISYWLPVFLYWSQFQTCSVALKCSADIFRRCSRKVTCKKTNICSIRCFLQRLFTQLPDNTSQRSSGDTMCVCITSSSLACTLTKCVF